MPTKLQDIAKTGLSRLWLIPDGAGPANAPDYQGQGRSTGLTWPQGDITKVEAPSKDSYDEFNVVGIIRGSRGLPGTSLELRQKLIISEMLKLVRKGCPFDVQVHFGACRNPSDFNGGWIDGKITVIEQAYPTDYSTGDLGAIGSDQRAEIMETIPVTGMTLYEIKPIVHEEQAADEVTDEVVDVIICDAVTCGACGVTSDGCQVAFALVGATAGSPGLPAELLYTEDGGDTWGATNIDTLALTENPNRMDCVGINLVVVSNDSQSLHYAPIADVLDGDEVWTEVTTGFVAAGAPNAIWSYDAQNTWIAGDAGYVYKADDPTSSVTAQTSGDITTQNLNDIHGFDDQNIVVVGASNAVLLTRSGGASWTLVTGPAAGVALNTVFMRSKTEWFVGAANGRQYYTLDSGETWTEKAFPGSGAGQVRHITFPTATVGYMAHDNATPSGRILRTIDGGYSWYVVPEEAGITLTANDRINRIAACDEDVNVVYAGGLADDGSDGILLKLL